MWDEIEIAISQATGEKFVGDRRQAQSGGCINQATKISDSQRDFFVKINQVNFLDIFETEAIALKQVYATNTIRVPKPICWGIAGDAAYLAMESLEFGGHQDWEAMGRNLAAMHHVTSARGFGWDCNNAIGATPQINNWTKDWVSFWIEYRLGFQISLAKRKGWRCSLPEKKSMGLCQDFLIITNRIRQWCMEISGVGMLPLFMVSL